MDKIFLLGKIYEDTNEDFIESKLKTRTDYEQMKSMYINETYKNDNSKMTIWNLYVKNVLYYEKSLGKDLYKFNIEELDGLISSIPSNSVHIKAGIYGFCTQYLDWCINKKLITINNMKALDRNLYTSISQKLASSRLISYNQFWDMVKVMEVHTGIQNIIPIVMAYYCIAGNDMEYMRNLKLEDLDKENEVAYMTLDGEIKAVIPIDDKFFEYCKKACEEANIGEDIKPEYVSTSTIIKPTINGRSDNVAENTLYARIYEAFDSANIKRIRLNDLAKSRKIALLMDIRRRRYLTTLDFQGVCSIFKPNCSRGIYNSLQKYYEQATSDKVLKANSKPDELVDVDLENNYRRILKNLDWEE